MKGFGGKFGVQTDRQDKSALGWDHQEKLQLHESQKGEVAGAFGLLTSESSSSSLNSRVLLWFGDVVFSVQQLPQSQQEVKPELTFVYTGVFPVTAQQGRPATSLGGL